MAAEGAHLRYVPPGPVHAETLPELAHSFDGALDGLAVQTPQTQCLSLSFCFVETARKFMLL